MMVSVPPPICVLPHGDDGILRVKLPVRVLIRLLYALDVLYDVQRADEVDVQRGCVSNEAQYHLARAEAGVDLNPLAEQPVFQALELIRIRVWFEYNDHNILPPPVKKTAACLAAVLCDRMVCFTRSPLLRQTETSLTVKVKPVKLK